jgi:hypothetical protein
MPEALPIVKAEGGPDPLSSCVSVWAGKAGRVLLPDIAADAGKIIGIDARFIRGKWEDTQKRPERDWGKKEEGGRLYACPLNFLVELRGVEPLTS